VFIVVLTTWELLYTLVSGIVSTGGYRTVVNAGMMVARRLTYKVRIVS
jgi:hypothetical protein